MESLREPNKQFDFSKLALSSPINVNGGNHFIKYNYEQCPLYIKSPPCSIKQGIVTTAKRIFCDLMFTNENSEFIEYIENLEQYSQRYIYQNREKWFETELEENDIENSFNSCMKIYKSGKFYLLRVSVPTILGKSNLKIYDENEQLIDIQNIKENDKVVCALEIQGIKCSARSFQIEIEVKQMLLINQQNIFEKCVLLKNKKPDTSTVNIENEEVKPNVVIEENDENKTDESNVVIEENCENEVDESIVTIEENCEDLEKSEDVDESITPTDDIFSNNENDENEIVINTNDQEIEKTQDNESTLEPMEINVEDIIKSNESNEPEECDIPLENFDNNVISLKKKNDVYYEMYRKALSKAKMAKELALASFLEAKDIKNTYMLEDIDDSDLDDSISLDSD
jgi:hypothetical protein